MLQDLLHRGLDGHALDERLRSPLDALADDGGELVAGHDRAFQGAGQQVGPLRPLLIK